MRRNLRVSVRYKVLGLISVVVLVALTTYLLLAISLFRNDKLAFVYDLNATLARTLGEEVDAAVTGLSERLQDFAAEALAAPPPAESTRPAARRGADATKAPKAGKAARAARGARGARPERGASAASPPTVSAATDEQAQRLLGRYTDVLALELWRRTPEGAYGLVKRWSDDKRLGGLGLRASDLAASRREAPLPFGTIAVERVTLLNSSMPPDVAVLTLAVLAPSKDAVIVADVRPDRLLRILGGTDIYSAALVDRQGTVLVHPDPVKVIERATMVDVPIVRQAIEGPTRRGVTSYVANGNEYIGAFSRLDGVGAVITAVPTTEALAATVQLVRKSVLFAAGILFLAVLGSVFFSRRLAAPLRKLEEAAGVVSRGEFDVAVAVRTRDEVGALAEAFNQMASELLDRDRRLEDTHQQLLQSSKLAVIGEMAAGISHEVKNPMASMRGLAQLGLEVPSLDKARELFAMIEKETTRATGILENLLRFARKDARVAYFELDANAVVTDSIRLVSHELQTKDIRVETSLGQGLPSVWGDARQIQQVLLNLMINAEHAMAEKGGGTLTLATSAADGYVRIAVRDTGVGIKPEDQPNLFRAFHTTKDFGTGLGLSVSQRIVTEHSGRIEVESELGKGSTFTVVLPTAGQRAVAGAVAAGMAPALPMATGRTPPPLPAAVGAGGPAAAGAGSGTRATDGAAAGGLTGEQSGLRGIAGGRG